MSLWPTIGWHSRHEWWHESRSLRENGRLLHLHSRYGHWRPVCIYFAVMVFLGFTLVVTRGVKYNLNRDKITFLCDSRAGVHRHLFLSENFSIFRPSPSGLPSLGVIVVALPIICLRLDPNVGAFVRHDLSEKLTALELKLRVEAFCQVKRSVR